MAATADDARHSVLSKARPLSQRSLDAFLEQDALLWRLPRAQFGRYEVREVDVKSALTLCAMPGQPWSLNPYVGCSHDCAYCYVPDVAHVEREKWGRYVLVKRNLPTVLAHELKRKERRDVFLSSATDPYQPVERDHRLTRACLELLLKEDWPVGVLTRNPLVRRDLALLSEFPEVSVGMSVPTLDDEMRKAVEPGAPPIEGRLRTLRAMADAGLEPFANLMPTYPLSGGVKPADIAQAFKDAGVSRVLAGAWRYLDSVVPALEKRVPEGARASLTRAVGDAAYYGRLFRQLKAAFAAVGVPLVVGGATPLRGRSLAQAAEPRMRT